MDFNNYSGNNPRFAGQPQNQPYPGGMSYYPQQGFPNQRPPIQQNMQFGFAPQQQPKGFPGRFGQGQFPMNPNPQMQQAFNQQQYQKMMEQQQRMAQENEKLNNETRKKRDFEMQQKRLQELRHGGGKKGGGDLSHLIGTLAEKGGGTKPAPKQHLATSTGKSLFSRPGGFYQAPQKQDSHEQQQHHQQQQHYQQQSQHSQPQPNMQHHPGQSEGIQQFSGQQHLQHFPGHSHTQPQPGQPSFPQHHGQPHFQQIPGQSNVQQQPGQSGFSQHPVQSYSQHTSGMQTQQSGFGNLSANPGTGADDDFSDFQEAPSFSTQGSVFPSQQGVFPDQGSAFPSKQGTLPGQGSAFPSQQGAFPDQGNAFPSKQGTLPGQGSAFPGQQSTFLGQGGSSLAPSNISNVVSSQSGPSWPNHSQNNPSWQMRPVPTSTMDVGFTSTQMVPGTSTVSSVTTIAQATSAITGPRARTDSQSSVSSSSSGGFLSSQPGHFGQSQYQPSLPGIQGTSFMAQGLAPTAMPGIPGQEQMKQMEQHGDVPGHMVPGSDGDGASQGEPEDPVKKLYGVDIPEWCRTGKDLPGVYKDVKDAVTMNGAIDTGKLHTLLLTSELHRDILGQLWSRVNKVTPGQLNDMELRMMLGLIALGQTGLKVERLTLEKLATCKSAPIPSFPEDVFKSEERSWSFQKEPDKEEKESSSLPVSDSFVGWQNQPSSNYSSTTDPSDKYSVFRMDNTSTSIASATTKESTGSFSSGSWLSAENSHSNLNQDVSRGTPMLGQFNQANKLSTSPDFQGFQSAVSHSEAESNDFGDFQGSVSSLDSAGGTSQQSGLSGTSRESGFDITSKLTASLEDFKLKRDTQQQGACEFSEFESFSSAETVTTSKSSIPGHSCGSHGDGSHGNKPNAFATFPSIKIPPEAESKSRSTTSMSFTNTPNITPNITTSAKPENKVESGWESTKNSSRSKIGAQDNTQTAVDKYSFLKDLDSFSAEDTSMQPSRKKDDSFGDFEGFEKAAHSAGDDFGDFHTTTTESVPGNQNLSPKQSQGWGFEGLSSIQQPKVGTNFANFENAQLQGSTSANPSDTSSTTHLQDDFGDFADFHSSTSTLSSGPTHVNDMPSSFPLNANFNQDMNGQVKNGFAVDQNRQRSSSTTSNSFTNTIPLDSTQRYKMLSDEGEDMEKHDNVWGRCLNSCLLTLVTGALAVQKMSDPALKQEVLMSKKGVEYFTALKEVFRVTQRIQVSLMKTEFGSDKLKNILLEINQSWKNISNFLAGSNIETNTSSECLTEHHIQADEDKTMACGVCLLNVNKSTSSGTDTKISYGGRDYHATCANFWCNRVDSILPKLLPVNSLI